MPVKTFSFSDVDKGIVTQFPSTKVAWTAGNNVRITPGFVSKTLGKTLITSVPNSLPIRAQFSFVGTDGAVRTIVCCDAKVFAYNSTFASYVDITPSPAPYSGGANDLWQFELVSGLPILTNGWDTIWKWTSYAGVLTELTVGPIYPNYLRISSCMNRLIISNVYNGSYVYPGRVQWSETGNPGELDAGHDEQSRPARYHRITIPASKLTRTSRRRSPAAMKCSSSRSAGSGKPTSPQP